MEFISGTSFLEVVLWLFAIGATTAAALIATAPLREDADAELERRLPDSDGLLCFSTGCQACGSLLPKAYGSASKGVRNPYCDECVDPLGELKPYADVHSAMVELLQCNGRTGREAGAAAHRYLSLMPAWSEQRPPSSRSRRNAEDQRRSSARSRAGRLHGPDLVQ
jgi:hypothetical protein